MELKTSFPSVNTLVLSIQGRVDASSIDQVKATWITAEQVQSIVVDLSQTTFIDSMGLAALVSGLKAARQRGGHFVIAAPSEPVRVILELTAMDRAFEITQTIEAALTLVGAA